MLKGIDPILGPELLSVLRAMGHGDEIVIADANFPAAAIAKPGRLVRADGIAAPRMVKAILSVLPLDDFAHFAAIRMGPVRADGQWDEDPPITAEFVNLLAAVGYTHDVGRVGRSAFYEQAKTAFAIVATGETRLYGNLILKKGVVRPESS